MKPSNRKFGDKGRRTAFECIALLLQGGGALGSYQAYLASDEHYLVGQIISPNGGIVI